MKKNVKESMRKNKKKNMRKNMKKSTLNSEKTSDNVIIRENHYKKYLGEMDHQILQSGDTSTDVFVEFYKFKPAPKRPGYTLITGGISEVKQNIPLDNKRTSGRTELIMYAREPYGWMFGLLDILSLMPFKNKTFLHWQSLYSMGICLHVGESEFTHILFMPPFFENECFYNTLHINGDKVDPLWAVPITEPEFQQCQHENGALAVMGKIISEKLPRMFN